MNARLQLRRGPIILLRIPFKDKLIHFISASNVNCIIFCQLPKVSVVPLAIYHCMQRIIIFLRIAQRQGKL